MARGPRGRLALHDQGFGGDRPAKRRLGPGRVDLGLPHRWRLQGRRISRARRHEGMDGGTGRPREGRPGHQPGRAPALCRLARGHRRLCAARLRLRRHAGVCNVAVLDRLWARDPRRAMGVHPHPAGGCLRPGPRLPRRRLSLRLQGRPAGFSLAGAKGGAVRSVRPRPRRRARCDVGDLERRSASRPGRRLGLCRGARAAGAAAQPHRQPALRRPRPPCRARHGPGRGGL